MDYEIGAYKKAPKKTPYLALLILLLVVIASIGLWKPVITGAFVGGDEGLVSIPTEEMVSPSPEGNVSPIILEDRPEELIASAEDEIFKTSAIPDYEPLSIAYSPLGPSAGNQVVINVTILEIGVAETGYILNVSLFIDGIFASQARVYDAGTGGVTFIASINWTATSGLHQMKVVIDSANELAEPDETNNNLTAMIGVDWPMIGQTTEHYGLSNGTPLLTNHTLWSFTVDVAGGENYPFQISVANNKVYFGTDNGTIFALNANTGAQIWSNQTGGRITGVPAIAYDRVYFGSNDGNVYALNATNGSGIWKYSSENSLDSSAAVSGDIVLIGVQQSDATTTYGIVALNATNGSRIWNSTFNGNVRYSSPAIYNNKVYIGGEISSTCNFYALNLSNGIQIWNHTLGTDENSYTTPVISNDRVYFGTVSNFNNTYCLNATTGARLWTANTSWGGYTSVPVLANNSNTLYVASNSGAADAGFGNITAFNALTGKTSWNSSVNGIDYYQGMAMIGDVLYFTDGYSYELWAINATNGSKIWAYNFTDESNNFVSLAAANNKIYATTWNKKVYAFGAADTAPPSSIQFVSPTPNNNTINIFNSIIINVTVADDTAVDGCILGWKDQNMASFVNYTMTKIGTGTAVFCNYTNSSLINGLNYTYQVYANDSSNNWNISTTRTYRENSVPAVSYASPTPANNTMNISNSITINVTASDDNITDTCLLGWKDQTMASFVNYTMTKLGAGASTSCYYTNNSLINGLNYTYLVYINDSNSEWNVTETRTFRENAIPVVLFANPTPTNNTIRTGNSVTINVTVGDDNSTDACLLSWKDENMASPVNYTMTKINTGTNVTCNYTNSTLTDGINYTYSIYANDSNGEWNISITQMFEENTKPSITSATITPDPAYDTNDLTCTVSGGSDAEGQALSYYYKWYLSLNLNFSLQNTSATTSSLTAGNTSVADYWSCIAIPHDGYENGSQKSDGVTITTPTTTTVTTVPSGGSGWSSGGGAPIEVTNESVCGNNKCEPDENQTTCCWDCGCANEFDCVNNKCESKCKVPVCETEPLLKVVYDLPGFRIPNLWLLLIIIMTALGIGMIYKSASSKMEVDPTAWHKSVRMPKASTEDLFRSRLPERHVIPPLKSISPKSVKTGGVYLFRTRDLSKHLPKEKPKIKKLNEKKLFKAMKSLDRDLSKIKRTLRK